MQAVMQAVRGLLKDTLRLYWSLLKIMIPVMLAVKVAVELGVIPWLGAIFAPVMMLVGLPPEMGVVWATTCLVNLYGGAAALLGVLPETPLTVAQMTVLSVMMLAGHGLPLEQRICQKAGASLIVTAALRLGFALGYGAILSAIYNGFDLLQQPLDITFLPHHSQQEGWGDWLLASAESLLSMLGILVVLLLVLRLMDASGLTRLLTRLLSPVLRLMGIGPQATPLTMIGVLLGLSYGGGLIIRDSQAGRLPPRDTFLAIAFLCLCHSLIEDTLFMMALGGHWSGVLLGRGFAAILLMAVLAPLIRALPPETFRRWLFSGGNAPLSPQTPPQAAS